MKKINLSRRDTVRVCISAFIILLVIFVITQFQNQISKKHQISDSTSSVHEIAQTIKNNKVSAEDLLNTYHTANLQILNNLKTLMSAESVEQFFSDAQNDDSVKLQGLIRSSFVPYLFLVDEDGNVLLSLDNQYCGRNARSLGFFDEQGFEELKTCPSKGVLTDSAGKKECYFYATPMRFKRKDCFLITGVFASAFLKQMEALTDVETIIDHEKLESGEVVMVINSQTKGISYCSDDQMGFEGQTLESAGIPEEVLLEKTGEIKLNGSNYLFASLQVDDDMTLVEVIKTGFRYSSNIKSTLWAVVFLVMILVTTICYVLNFPREYCKKKGEQMPVHLFGTKLVVNKVQVIHVIPFVIWGMILIFCGVFYCRTILKLSWEISDVERPLNCLQLELTSVAKEKEELQKYCEQLFCSKAQIVANMIEIDPTCLNEETDRVHVVYTEAGEKQIRMDSSGNPIYSIANSDYLKNLCLNNNFQTIQIFNDQGYVIASSYDNWFFELGMNPEDQSYSFRNVLDGKKAFLIQNAQVDDEGNENQYVGVPFYYYTTKDSYGSTKYVSSLAYKRYKNGGAQGTPITKHLGMLQCALNPEETANLTKTIDLDFIIPHINLSNDAYMVVFDSSPENRILYTPNKVNLGKTAAELNISEQEFSGSFNGFQTVQGIRYFECCRYSNGYYVAVATPLSSLYADRLAITGFATLVCLIAMILILGLFLITSEEEMMERQLPQANGSSKGILAVWRQKNATEKTTVIVHFCLFLVGVYFLLGILTKGMFFADTTVVQYVLSDKWERGINIFAFTKSAAVFSAVFVVVFVLKWLIHITSSVTDSRFATICNLLISFVQYAAIIVAIFYSLYLFGMQPMSLLTSAGILTAVIGFGSQSLIADMLAGIFLVFEGTFHVGDLVNIQGTYGFIKEIGIRTTIVRDLSNNLIVFNNNSIKGLANLSVKVSTIRLDFAIASCEKLEQVEEVLLAELSTMKEKIPELLTVPTYEGIHSMESGQYTLFIKANCKSLNFAKASCAMRRELILAFNKNNITIPGATVVVDMENS